MYLQETLSEAVRYNEQIKLHLHRMADDLNPLRVQALFEAIPDEDCDVLDVRGRPENLVVTHIAVPPVAIRPSVDMDGASNEDDVTMKLMVGRGGRRGRGRGWGCSRLRGGAE